MTSINVVDTTGKCIDVIAVEPSFINKDFEHEVLYKVIHALKNNENRLRYSHYKGVGAVRGSNRKIRPQKRVGKARQGCNREIHMRGGGVKFGFSGNKTRDIAKRYKRYLDINKKERKLCMRIIMTNKIENKLIYVVKDLGQISKTKEAVSLLENLNIKRCLFVYSSEHKEHMNFFRNIRDIDIKNIASLNSLNTIQKDHIIFDQNAIKKILTDNARS